MRITLVSLAVVMALGGSAAAQDEYASTGASREGGFGVGAEAMLTGPAGALFVYDAGAFYINGVLGLADLGDDTTIALGGRFFYVLHSSTAADFALGGGLGFINSDDAMDDDETDVHLEGGGQIRAFIVPNVAVSAFLGLSIVIDDGDNDGIVFSGQRVGAAGGAGIAYFF